MVEQPWDTSSDMLKPKNRYTSVNEMAAKGVAMTFLRLFNYCSKLDIFIYFS